MTGPTVELLDPVATPFPELNPPALQLPAVQMAELNGPMAAAIQAIRAGMSVADMKELLGLQERWEGNEARKAFADDMAKYKLNPPEILKDKHVTFETSKGTTSYDHATIGNVCDQIIASAAAHGFSSRWVPGRTDDGRIVITTVITHRLGHSEETRLEGASDLTGGKNAIQADISTTSYLSRHGLLMAYGFATKDQPDDDGKGAGAGAYDPAVSLEHWSSQARQATTLDALKEVRAKAGFAFTSNKDEAGWLAYKEVNEARKKALIESGAQ